MRSINWHPIFFAAYPTLHLLAVNIDEIKLYKATPPLLVSVAVASFFYLTSSALFRNRLKGALWSSLGVILFFSYGHVIQFLDGGPQARWGILGGAALAMGSAGIWLELQRSDLRPINRVLDFSGSVLLVLALFPVIHTELDSRPDAPDASQAESTSLPLDYIPDIYVIIADGMGRSDVLQLLFDVDMTDFQNHLKFQGFQIAEMAMSNYCQTELSLASLLNSDYLENLLPVFGPEVKDRKILYPLVQENKNFRKLKRMGYKLVDIPGSYDLSEQTEADLTLRGGMLNEFELALLSMTPIPFLNSMISTGATDILDPYAQHRETVRYQFNKLPNVITGGGPKVVFAHIISPHPPFVLGADGNEITPEQEYSLRDIHHSEEYVTGYAGQARWVVNELKKTIGGILQSSRRPPVILVMGDHGPASLWVDFYRRHRSFRSYDPSVIAERMSIFLALYMPPGPGGEVYPELSPVNVFPLIFERCFGEKAFLKKDRSYFSTYDEWALLWDALEHKPFNPTLDK